LAATIDHLLWGCRDLDLAIEELHARSGVRAAPGGRHPELGTHNALARLGGRVFLELIAPDPSQVTGEFARKLAHLPKPTLLMWAARTTNATATAASAKAAGYSAAIVKGHRIRTDGQVVRWTNVFVSGHGAGTLVPFFIQWNAGDHPAANAPAGLKLKSFTIETPQPTSVGEILEALDVKVSVHKGPRDRLLAEIDGSPGPLVLAGPTPSVA
jgi:hypothetical protein